MVQVCYLRLYLGNETAPVFCCYGCQGWTWIETFQVLMSVSVKITKTILFNIMFDIFLITVQECFVYGLKALSYDFSIELT